MLIASILTQPAALGWMLLALTAILMLKQKIIAFKSDSKSGLSLNKILALDAKENFC